MSSLNAQNNSTFEVVIVNDGSTDNTQQWLENNKSNYKFPFKIINQDNQGKGRAALRGWEESRGLFCLFLDVDDELLPGAIDVFEQYIKNNQEVDVIFANHASYRDKVNNSEYTYSQNPKLHSDKLLNLKSFLIDKRYSFATGAYVFKRELAPKFFYSLSLSIAEDIPFEAHLLANCHCITVPESTVLIHKHDDSRRHNWEGYYADYVHLIEEVFDERKLPQVFFSLKSAFIERVVRSLFNKLYKSGEYNKAVNVIQQLSIWQRLKDFKIAYRFLVCLMKRN